MKRKTINYILIGFFAFVLFAGAEIAGVRLKFGSAFINDTTASYVSLNKGLKINGLIMVNDSVNAGARLTAEEIYLEGIGATITWGGYGGYITEGASDQLNYGSNNHVIETEYGTDLVQIDSATGLGYNPVANSLNEGLLRTKIVRGVMPTTAGTIVSIAHGIESDNIRMWNSHVKLDTTGTASTITAGNDWLIAPQNTILTGGLYYASVDSLYCNARTAATTGSAALFGDTVYFFLMYIDN